MVQSPPGQAKAIAAGLRAQIAAGTLAPGARLPSTRALAAERGVSRGTVTAAYEQLLAEGYLRSRPGARTEIAPGLRAAAAPPPAATPAEPTPLSAFGRRLAAAAPEPARPAIADFRFGDLAAEDFPLLAWKRALNAALHRRAAWTGYGPPQGQPALLAALAAYLWRARGLRCAPEQIVVVNGSQQGIDLCARLALDPGAAAVVEDPGYKRARDAFHAAGAVLLAVPVDQDGLVTDALPPGRAVRIAHLTPSHQVPLGGVLSAGRRAALLDWARRSGAWLLEDDHDSEYRYDIAPIPPLAAQPGAARVIYLGTVSKTLAPGLRLGYLVPPPELVAPFRAAKLLTDRHSPALEQEALAGLIASGAYEAHLRRIRRRHAARRAALVGALRTWFGARVHVAGAAAGLHVLVWFPGLPHAAEAGLVAAAREGGIGLYPVGPFYAGARPDRAGMVMGYGGLTPERITAGVARLAGILSPTLSAPPGAPAPPR